MTEKGLWATIACFWICRPGLLGLLAIGMTLVIVRVLHPLADKMPQIIAAWRDR